MGRRTGKFFSEPQRCSQKRPSVAVGGFFETVHRNVRRDCHGIGAVLEQEGEHGSHPVAFASRKLSSAENNFPVHERELLAIVYALEEWRPYLHGSRFVIKTDHHPMRYLDTHSNRSKRQMRWMETLQEYAYEIVYVQGKFNVVADATSRINESPSTALYMESEDDEDSDVVALNVVES
jgi:hypothetical protein